MSSIFLATFQLTLLLHCVTSPSPSGPAELLPALLSVGCLHPRLVSLCSLLGRVTHCCWHALRRSDVEGSALPSPPQTTQPKASSAIQTLQSSPVCCSHGSHLSPSLWIRLPRRGLCVLQTAWGRRAGVAGKMKNSVIY